MKKFSKKLLALLLVFAMLIPTGAMTVTTTAEEDETVYTDGVWAYKVVDGYAMMVGVTEVLEGDVCGPPPYLGGYPLKVIDGINCGALAGIRTTQFIIPQGVEQLTQQSFNTGLFTSVVMPLSLKYIDFNAFPNCYNFTTIYYEGTEEDWNNISIAYPGLANAPVVNATKYYNYKYPVDALKKYKYCLTINVDKGGYVSDFGVKFLGPIVFGAEIDICNIQNTYIPDGEVINVPLEDVLSGIWSDALPNIILEHGNKFIFEGGENLIYTWKVGYVEVGYSDDGDVSDEYYICGKKFDKNIDDYISECSSSVYNPGLANMTAALSKAVYSADEIENAYLSLGFDKDQFDFYDYGGEFNPYKSGHTIGLKKSKYNDDIICLVVVRGTVIDSVSDWLGNISIATTADGKHTGFAYPADNVYSNINSLLEKKQVSGKIKYVITGHSRGAAVANLLAVKLMEKGVGASDIYNYNFACPDVACKIAFVAYSNIFNLCNREDPVPFVPGHLASTFTTSGTSWGKYGQTYWFTKDAEDTINPVADHDMGLYLEFFDQQKMPEEWGKSFWDKVDDSIYWTKGLITKIFCPVDVIVKDADGNKIASVIGDEVNYYDSSFGDVIILTDGDKKIIFVSGDNDFNVELIGTDDGTMTYSVEKCNLATEEISESKTFENVKLEKGKEMYSPVSNAETTEDVELFVVDYENGEDIKTHTIGTDGSETEINHIYETEVVNPTCTEKGYTVYTCSNCSDSYKDSYVDALGHSDANHDGICDACSEDFTKGCSCNCHGNAFMQFLHKIVTFLRKLFGMTEYQYCACGKAHW